MIYIFSNKESDENFLIAKDFAVANLKNHRFLETDKNKV